MTVRSLRKCAWEMALLEGSQDICVRDFRGAGISSNASSRLHSCNVSQIMYLGDCNAGGLSEYVSGGLHCYRFSK